jgi:hypothetical protein
MAFTCNAHVSINLWIMDLHWMPHSNQNTKANIESYHGVLKRWFSSKTKVLKECHIDWLVWRLITIVAWHYMHQMEMNRWQFIVNKVVAQLVAANVKNGLLIPHVNVIHSTLVGEDNVCAWMAWSWHHLGVIHNLHCPFTKYASCTFKWALRGNLCKW